MAALRAALLVALLLAPPAPAALAAPASTRAPHQASAPHAPTGRPEESQQLRWSAPAPAANSTDRRRPAAPAAPAAPDTDADADAELVLPEDEDEPMPEHSDYDESEFNISATGMYLGSPCEFTCDARLHHVYCDPVAARCDCDRKHPVRLGPNKGCAKPKKLGEQCFYRATCRAFDPHASCVQVNHNAFCQCEQGYHIVTHSRPVYRVFCTEDLALLTAELPTLLGVASGIFVLAGLLCMVLHLYTRARFHPRHLADSHFATTALYSYNDNDNDNGGGMSTRPNSRASSRSAGTGGTLDSAESRRTSRTRGGHGGHGGGVQVSASRAGAARAAAILLVSCHLRAVRGGGAHPAKCAAQGSRRPSITSIQSSSSSIRSYSTRRFEQELEQKERRQQMNTRLAQLHRNMTRAEITLPKHAPTPSPSPRSPNNSTDNLLPAVCEKREMALEASAECPCSSSSLY